jgi:hypothetical protein
MGNGYSTAESSFSPSAGFPPARAGDAPPLAAPASKKAYESESIARRAEQTEVCARHLLAGAFQSNRDCVEAIVTIPPECFPDELRPVAQAVIDLHSRGVAVDSTSLYLELTSAKVDAPGSLLAGLGTYASCAPDLDARALWLAFGKSEAANRLGLISEIAERGDLEAARAAFGDLDPFAYAPAPPDPLPLADVDGAGEVPDPLFKCGIYPGRLSLLVGESGIGKSTLALTAAASFASGRKLLSAFTPNGAGRVLFLSGEDDAAVLRKRLEALEAAYGVKVPRDRLHFVDAVSPLLTVDGAGTTHITPAWTALRKKAGSYGLVTLDPFVSWLAAGNENDAGTIGRLAEHLKALAAETGAAVLVSHHTSKHGALSLEQGAARGSGALAAAARWIGNLARPGEGAQALGIEPEDCHKFLRFGISKNSYGSRAHGSKIFERDAAGVLHDADPGAQRWGDLAEVLAGILADTDVHLTRFEIIRGQGKAARGIRDKLAEVLGAVSRRDLEGAVAYGLQAGLLKEIALEPTTRGRARVELAAAQ